MDKACDLHTAKKKTQPSSPTMKSSEFGIFILGAALYTAGAAMYSYYERNSDLTTTDYHEDYRPKVVMNAKMQDEHSEPDYDPCQEKLNPAWIVATDPKSVMVAECEAGKIILTLQIRDTSPDQSPRLILVYKKHVHAIAEPKSFAFFATANKVLVIRCADSRQGKRTAWIDVFDANQIPIFHGTVELEGLLPPIGSIQKIEDPVPAQPKSQPTAPAGPPNPPKPKKKERYRPSETLLATRR